MSSLYASLMLIVGWNLISWLIGRRKYYTWDDSYIEMSSFIFKILILMQARFLWIEIDFTLKIKCSEVFYSLKLY